MYSGFHDVHTQIWVFSLCAPDPDDQTTHFFLPEDSLNLLGIYDDLQGIETQKNKVPSLSDLCCRLYAVHAPKVTVHVSRSVAISVVMTLTVAGLLLQWIVQRVQYK